MRKVMMIFAVLAIWTICACDNREMKSAANFSKDTSYAVAGLTDNPLLSADADKQSQRDGQTAGSFETEHRKVIKQGEISFKTDDINKTRSLISQKVQELGGYISKDNSNEYQQTLVIRVPAGNFDPLIQNISENAGKFDNKNIDVLDVTEEYIDVSARIKTKKELQARFAELLKRAANIDEILKIEREIGSLQTEIESAEGRMKYLKDRIAFSTLTVTYYKAYQRAAAEFNFFSKFADGIKNGLYMFLALIIGLAHLWVFIVIAAAVICLIKFWKRKKKSKTVSK